MHRILTAFCATLLLAGAAHAGIDNAGTTAGSFLSVGTGAGILGMGGATLGAGHDLNAAAWNPAALGALENTQFAISHATLASQSSQDWLATGGRLGALSTRWAATALYQGDGSFDGRDAFGASTGSFSVSSMAIGMQLAQPIGQNLAAGIGAHWLSDKLGDVAGSGLALDAGLQASAGAFGFGAAMRNVGGSMKYDAGTFDLPAVFGVGASWSNAARGLRFALDANFPRAYYDDVRAGAEWRWQDRIALRAGYRLEVGAQAGEPLGGPSFGLGAGANGLWMDYAFLANGGDAQGQHRLGLTFHPGFLGNRALRPVADGGASEPAEPVAVAAPKRAPQAEKPAEKPASSAPASSAPMANAPAPAPVPASSAPVKPTASAPVAAATPAPAPELPANAMANDVAPRTTNAPRIVKVSATRPVKVAPLVMPAPAEAAAVAPATTPVAATVPVAAPTPAPANVPVAAPTVAPQPEVVASAAAPAVNAPVVPVAVTKKKGKLTRKTPMPAPAPVAAATPAASAPVATTPAPAAPAPVVDAPAPAAAPPVAQVASSRPRIMVVSRPADPATSKAHFDRPAIVTVGAGESMADIAAKWHTSVAAIMMENDLVKDNVTKGQKLKLPHD
jgi:hypothetical protein